MKMRASGGCSSGSHDWVKMEIPRGVLNHSLSFFSFLDLKYSSSGMSPHGNNNGTGAAGGVSSAIAIVWWVTLVWVLDQFFQLVCLLLDATPKFFFTRLLICIYYSIVKHILIKFALELFLQIASYTKAQVSSLEDMRRHVSESYHPSLSIYPVTFHPLAARMMHYKNPAERRHHHLPFTSLWFPCSLNPKTSIVNNKLFVYVLGCHHLLFIIGFETYLSSYF